MANNITSFDRTVSTHHMLLCNLLIAVPKLTKAEGSCTQDFLQLLLGVFKLFFFTASKRPSMVDYVPMHT